MRSPAVLACCLALAATLGAQPRSGDLTARDVAARVHDRDTGRDSVLDMTMRLFDRQGRVRARALTVTSLRGAGAQGDRVLIRFLAPGDIKGTGLLVWEHPTGADERFLYLPALGRVRRIVGAEAQESFVGSDLSYEDVGGPELDDYTYTFVERDASWTAPDGVGHPAWRIESRAVDQQAPFPRRVSLVRKDNAVVVAAEIDNRRGDREKRYEVRRLERVDGVWTTLDVVVVNDLQHTRTELVVNRARYNVGLSAADFTRRVLEQGAP